MATGLSADPALWAAHSEVERACGFLVVASPTALDDCAKALAAATAMLEAGGGAPTPAHASHFRQDLLRAHRLLETAADFHLGWARRAGALAGGYCNGGEPAALQPPTRCLATG